MSPVPPHGLLVPATGMPHARISGALPATDASSSPFVQWPRPARLDVESLAGLATLPSSGYLEILKELAAAEALAGALSVGATGAMSLFSANPLGLAVVGPVMEKVGFYALALGRELVHPTANATLRERLGAVLRGGSENLLRDICFHDTIYSGLLWGALTATQGAWATALAPVAFIVALALAPRAELLTGELLLQIGKRAARQRDFQSVRYLEARCILTDRVQPMDIFLQLVEQFGLSEHTLNRYTDRYFPHRVPDLSNRDFQMRTRTIQSADGLETYHHSFEILFTRPHLRHRAGQHPSLEIGKHKLWKDIDPARDVAGQIWPRLARRVDFAHGQNEIPFLRRCAYNDALRVAIDMVPTGTDGEALYMLEIKAYPEHQGTFARAMQYLQYLTGMHPTFEDKPLLRGRVPG